ncbi:unnamed protein product [Camellia sinensis]
MGLAERGRMFGGSVSSRLHSTIANPLNLRPFASDPRDDLSGMDVARKALILARLLGQRIDLDNIKVESLYPEEMGPNLMHVEDFLVNGLPLLDKGIQERVERASSNGNVLRYVCVIEDSRAAVMWVDEQDGEAIELAFSKKKIEARKNWLRQFEPGTYLDQKEKLIKYSDFVNKELILFSRMELAYLLEEKNMSLAAIQAAHESEINNLGLELEKERDKLANIQLKLQEELKLNKSFQEELNLSKVDKDKKMEMNKIRDELNEKISEVRRLQIELTRRENAETDDIADGLKRAIATLEKENNNLKSDKINLDIQRVVGYRQWCNKLWNAVRFAMSKLGDNYTPPTNVVPDIMPFNCQWILSVLNKAISKTVTSLELYEFSVAATAVYSWWQFQLCDVFIEAVKPYFASDAQSFASERSYAQDALSCWTNEKVAYEMDMVESAVKSLRSLKALMPAKERHESERDELCKDIEQLCMQQAGPGYLAVATRMHFQRTAGLEQEIESLKEKLTACTREKLNLQEELSEAYRIKGQLADLHVAEVSKNMEVEKQIKFFQGCVASAFAERDHSIME